MPVLTGRATTSRRARYNKANAYIKSRRSLYVTNKRTVDKAQSDLITRNARMLRMCQPELKYFQYDLNSTSPSIHEPIVKQLQFNLLKTGTSHSQRIGDKINVKWIKISLNVITPQDLNFGCDYRFIVYQDLSVLPVQEEIGDNIFAVNDSGKIVQPRSNGDAAEQSSRPINMMAQYHKNGRQNTYKILKDIKVAQTPSTLAFDGTNTQRRSQPYNINHDFYVYLPRKNLTFTELSGVVNVNYPVKVLAVSNQGAVGFNMDYTVAYYDA